MKQALALSYQCKRESYYKILKLLKIYLRIQKCMGTFLAVSWNNLCTPFNFLFRFDKLLFQSLFKILLDSCKFQINIHWMIASIGKKCLTNNVRTFRPLISQRVKRQQQKSLYFENLLILRHESWAFLAFASNCVIVVTR